MIWLLLWACVDASDTAASCVHDPAVSWERGGEGFMTKHCTGCHGSLLPSELRNGAPVGVDFDSYEGVVTWADRIAARVLDGVGSMPPGGGLTDEELGLLDEWLTCEVLPDQRALGPQGGVP